MKHSHNKLKVYFTFLAFFLLLTIVVYTPLILGIRTMIHDAEREALAIISVNALLVSIAVSFFTPLILVFIFQGFSCTITETQLTGRNSWNKRVSVENRDLDIKNFNLPVVGIARIKSFESQWAIWVPSSAVVYLNEKYA